MEWHILKRRERGLAVMGRISAALYARSDPDDIDGFERQLPQAATETVDSND